MSACWALARHTAIRDCPDVPMGRPSWGPVEQQQVDPGTVCQDGEKPISSTVVRRRPQTADRGGVHWEAKRRCHGRSLAGGLRGIADVVLTSSDQTGGPGLCARPAGGPRTAWTRGILPALPRREASWRGPVSCQLDLGAVRERGPRESRDGPGPRGIHGTEQEPRRGSWRTRARIAT